LEDAVDETSSTTEASYDSYAGPPLVGCATAVNEQIQVISTEIGYFSTVLALLQVRKSPVFRCNLFFNIFISGRRNRICMFDTTLLEEVSINKE
jgi:hypothetical protein